MITDEDIQNAWDRIARTPDGAVAYAHLQKVAISILGDADPSDGALRREFGRRSLAHELMGRMAKGIEESGGRSTDNTSSGTGKLTERPLVFAVRQPARTGRRESPREYAIRTSAEQPTGSD